MPCASPSPNIAESSAARFRCSRRRESSAPPIDSRRPYPWSDSDRRSRRYAKRSQATSPRAPPRRSKSPRRRRPPSSRRGLRSARAAARRRLDSVSSRLVSALASAEVAARCEAATSCAAMSSFNARAPAAMPACERSRNGNVVEAKWMAAIDERSRSVSASRAASTAIVTTSSSQLHMARSPLPCAFSAGLNQPLASAIALRERRRRGRYAPKARMPKAIRSDPTRRRPPSDRADKTKLSAPASPGWRWSRRSSPRRGAPSARDATGSSDRSRSCARQRSAR